MHMVAMVKEADIKAGRRDGGRLAKYEVYTQRNWGKRDKAGRNL